MRNYETAYYDAVLSDSESFEQWTERGGKDTAQRAFERWNEAPPLEEHGRAAAARRKAVDEDAGTQARFDASAKKKQASMPDAWY